MSHRFSICFKTCDYSNESQLSLNYRYLDSICKKLGLSKVHVLAEFPLINLSLFGNPLFGEASRMFLHTLKGCNKGFDLVYTILFRPLYCKTTLVKIILRSRNNRIDTNPIGLLCIRFRDR